MEAKNNTSTSVILIGKANEYFNSEYQPNRAVELKFVVIKSNKDSPVQLLLMKQFTPYQYHAEALLHYMNENSLTEVIVNGGGVVKFSPESFECSFHGKSYAFGRVCVEEVQEFANNIWPSLAFISLLGITGVNNIDVSGEVYTLEKVKY